MPTRRPARSANPLRCERLEDRAVPAIFGNAWPDPGHLTVSFVPDGTDVAGAQSTLNKTLGAMPTATWQGEILRAFENWAQVANLNVSVVSDNGSALGKPRPAQGSASFGNIRVSARPLSDNVLAVTNPFDLFSSWAGDIVLNSNKVFGVGSAPGQYDLFTVLLQESGHSLGIDNSPDAGSVMFETYGTPRAGINATDVASIQALYGARTPDRFDLGGANDTLKSADAITPVTDPSQLAGTDGTAGDKPLVAAGDLTTLVDVDTYAFKTPKAKGSSDFTVSLLTDGVSLLKAKVTVFDDGGNVVKSAVATPPGGGKPFTLLVSGAKPDATYRVQVEGATEDVFGVGAYKLSVGGQSATAVQVRIPATFSTASGEMIDHSDEGGANNDSLAASVDLGDARPRTDARWDFTGTASIGTPGDNDFYHLKTQSATLPVMVVTVFDTVGGALTPLVTVYDRAGNVVPAEVLQSDRGTITLQIQKVLPNADYYVRVQAKDAAGPLNTGSYFLGIDFRAKAVTLSPLASATLQGATNQAVTGFTLSRSQSIWFDLAGQAGVNAAVRLTVYDANNVAVFTLKAKGGESAGGDVLLAPGQYYVRFTAAGANGAALPSFAFTARFNLGNDPIGVQPVDGSAPVPTASGTPTLWTPAPLPGGDPNFLGPNTVPVGPVAGGTSGVLTWTPVPPKTTFYTATLNDLYTNPWW